MCGVLVHVRATPGHDPVDGARWERAIARLARRGPDGRGRWESPSGLATFGHTRLAINDLSPAGAQPMVLERGRRAPLALVANGEIYNAPALRRDLDRQGARFAGRSDCEVLLHATARWGFERAIGACRGMFGVVVWDEESRTLHGAVDHAGMKPLVYAEHDGGIVVSSDADAVRAMLEPRPGPDANALALVLAHGYCPAPRTVWAGVRKLGPGECFEWRPGGPVRVGRWWRPPAEASGPSDPREQDEQFATIWGEVLRDHLLSDVPVGLFLSGGLDSSAVAAGLREARAPGMPPVAALTLALDSPDDESPAAAATARHLGLAHTAIPLAATGLDAALEAYADAFDEPQGYGALLTAVTLARAARRHGTVMLAGDGGDEAFGGYTWHTEMDGEAAGGARRELARGGGGSASGVAAAVAAPASTDFASSHLRRVLARWEAGEIRRLLSPLGVTVGGEELGGWASVYDVATLPRLRRAQVLDLMTFCAGSILPKVDRASMGVGLEVRAPLLDRRVLDWALSLPPAAGEGLPGSPSKPVLRRYLASRVPAGVLARPKQGFSLRLGPGAWEAAGARLPESRLVRDGMVDEHWREILRGPQHAGKRQALVMLASWWEGRG